MLCNDNIYRSDFVDTVQVAGSDHLKFLKPFYGSIHIDILGITPSLIIEFSKKRKKNNLKIRISKRKKNKFFFFYFLRI